MRVKLVSHTSQYYSHILTIILTCSLRKQRIFSSVFNLKGNFFFKSAPRINVNLSLHWRKTEEGFFGRCDILIFIFLRLSLYFHSLRPYLPYTFSLNYFQNFFFDLEGQRFCFFFSSLFFSLPSIFFCLGIL